MRERGRCRTFSTGPAELRGAAARAASTRPCPSVIEIVAAVHCPWRRVLGKLCEGDPALPARAGSAAFWNMQGWLESSKLLKDIE
jgi:hypothetical protein